jgi:ferredoxin
MNCWEICPQVFEEGPDDGLSQVVKAYRIDNDPARGEIPKELEDCVRDAAEACPVEIIRVED